MAKYGTSSYYEDLYAGRSTKSTPVQPKFGTSSWEARYGKVTKLYGKSYTAKTSTGEDIRIKRYTPGYFAKRTGQRPSVYISPSKERYGISQAPPKPTPKVSTPSTSPLPSQKTTLQQIAGRKQPVTKYKTIYTAGEEVRVSPKVYDKWVKGQRKETAKRIAGEVLYTAGHPGYVPNIIEPIYERTIGQRLRGYTYKKIPKESITKTESKVVADVYYAKRPSGEMIAIPKVDKVGNIKTKVIEPKEKGITSGIKGKALRYVREKPSGVLAIATEISVTAGATSLATTPRTTVPKAFKNLVKVKPKPAKVETALIKRPISADGLIKYEPVVKGKQDILLYFKKPKRLYGLIKPKTTIKKGSITVPLQDIGVIQKGKTSRIAERSLWSQIKIKPKTFLLESELKPATVQASKSDLVSISKSITPKKQLFFSGIKSQKLYDVTSKGYKLSPGKVKTTYIAGLSQEIPETKSILGNIKIKGGVFKTQRVFKTSGRLSKKSTIGVYKQSEFMWKSPKEVPKRTIKDVIRVKPTLLQESQRANIKSFRLTEPFKGVKTTSSFPKAGKGTRVEVIAKPISELRAESTAKTSVKLLLEEETTRIGGYAKSYVPKAKTLIGISTPKLSQISTRKQKIIIKPVQKIKPIQRESTSPKEYSPIKQLSISRPSTKTSVTPVVRVDVGEGISQQPRQDTTARPRITFPTPPPPIPGFDFGFRPPPPSPPGFLLPPLWFTPRMKGAKPRKPKRGRKPYKYNPSLSAVFLNIKGLKPKRLTGLEVRPIIKRKKDKKKKGRKK